MQKSNVVSKIDKKFWFLLGFFIFLSVCMIGIFRLSFPLKIRGANHKDAGSVSRAFFDALMVNDIDLAKSVVIDSQHARLDTWMLEHKAFACPLYWSFTGEDFLENPWRDGVGGCKNNSCEYYEGISCYRSGSLAYSFSVGSIRVKQLNTEWFVVDWDDVHEQRSD